MKDIAVQAHKNLHVLPNKSSISSDDDEKRSRLGDKKLQPDSKLWLINVSTNKYTVSD